MSVSPIAIERRLCAILAADTVNYSRLVSRDDVAAIHMLAERRDTANELIVIHCGRVVDNAGDSILAEFQSAADAVHCGIAIQQALAELNRTVVAEMQMQLRIGIHLGDVLVKGQEVFGHGVNIAARLQAIADPGGICVSDVVRMTAGGGATIEFEPLGEKSLKNIDEPVSVYRARQRPGTAMPARSASGHAWHARGTLRQSRVSVSRMPVTGRLLLGRESEIRLLDQGWGDPACNVISLVAWGGVGKSTLLNHWLRAMAADGFRGAQAAFAWSFYHQGTVDRVTAADDFISTALEWFGEPAPQSGSARLKGERLARLIQQQRTLLVLDGLETLQRPPGEHEGRLLDEGLHSLLCELASVNPGLCVITTRFAVTDLQDYRHSHRQLDLVCLGPSDGADLLRACGVRGSDRELGRASEEFGGHCLALTLLASYLNDGHGGNVADRHHIDALQDDVRLGGHTRRVLNSYVTWIDDAAEMDVLRCIGLYDRPASGESLRALRMAAIESLTLDLSRLSDAQVSRAVARLRRAGLLAERDPASPDSLDAHPLVRQFFRDQLKSESSTAWKRGNACLYRHFSHQAPHRPATLAEMNDLFQAVIFGCRAGLHGHVFNEVYLPRIMHGEQLFAANVLDARGTLLMVLSHFFVDGSWDRVVEPDDQQEGLPPKDQLVLLLHVRMLLTATYGYNDAGVMRCSARLRALCEHDLGSTSLLYSVSVSNWMHALVSEPLEQSLQHAREIEAFAQNRDDPALMIGACRCLSDSLFFMGSFTAAEQYARRGIELWEGGATTPARGEVSLPIVTCLCFAALVQFQFGDFHGALARIDRAVSTAEDLAHAHSIAVALHFDGYVAHLCGDPLRAERTAHRLVELSQRNGFRFWHAGACVQLGWAKTLLGKCDEGLPLIAEGLGMWRATNAELIMPYWLAMSVEAHCAAGHSAQCPDLLEAAIKSADLRGESWWKADLLRLRGSLLIDAGQTEQGVRLLWQAMEVAARQGSIALQLRAANVLAEQLLAAHRPGNARALLTSLFEKADQRLVTADLRATLALLARCR